MSMLDVPTYDDVIQAAARLAGVAYVTPVLTSRTVDAEFDAQVFFKCENFQRTGAFKFRGAYNAISRLLPEQRERGVIAYSGGNHAQGVALSARLLGTQVTILMPQDTPASKVDATRNYGGHVITYDRYRDDREKIGRELAVRHGLSLIPPYDHRDVIAGQGTVAKELIDEVGPLDALFVCLGGGGLLAGSALSTHALSPECLLYGVEPEVGNDGQQSLRAGKIVHIETPRTIADGAQSRHLGQLTFPIIQRHVDDILTVTDDELVSCMRFFIERMKIVVEPTGCLGFAAARRMRAELKHKKIGVLISGGNIDSMRLGRFFA